MKQADYMWPEPIVLTPESEFVGSMMEPLVLDEEDGRVAAAMTYWPGGPTVWVYVQGLNAAGCLKLSEWLDQAAGEISWVKDHGRPAS